MKTLIILALVGLLLPVGSAHPFGEENGETLDDAQLQDITNEFQAEDTESDADLEDKEVDDPAADEDELDEVEKEGDGDGDENAVVGGETYNADENALSTPGDKSSDPIIPFILMGRRIVRRFRRRRGRGRRRFRFRRFRRRRSRG